MHAQTIKCVFNRIGMPKLLGLVKFRLTIFLKDYLFYFNIKKKKVLFRKKYLRTHKSSVSWVCFWQLPYLHLAFVFVFVFTRFTIWLFLMI